MGFMKRKNKLIFQGGNCSSIKILGGKIINLIKYLSQIKGSSYTNNIHLIISPNVDSLPMQILEENLRIEQSEVETEDLFGDEIDQLEIEYQV
jgi:hypothetical protein